MTRKKKIITIKYGGHAMEDAGLSERFYDDLALLAPDMDFVVVHGGGPQIAENLRRLGIPSTFKDGLRVTDEATLEVVEAVLCGTVNKKIVRELAKRGSAPLGLSGMDGPLLRAKTADPALGRVGEVYKVNAGVLEKLLADGFIPIVAPLGLDEAFEPSNVNADTAAGAVAGALRADYFALISDVPGVLDADGKLLEHLTWPQIEALRRENVIAGGMIPKTQACHDALKAGCAKSIILDGRQPGALRRFLADGEALGTVIELA